MHSRFDKLKAEIMTSKIFLRLTVLFFELLLLNFLSTSCSKIHYIRTSHDIELTTDLGNASLVSWLNSQSSCEELCNLEVGQFANNSIVKYGKITGKCECFLSSSLNNYTHIGTNQALVFFYDRECFETVLR